MDRATAQLGEWARRRSLPAPAPQAQGVGRRSRTQTTCPPVTDQRPAARPRATASLPRPGSGDGTHGPLYLPRDVLERYGVVPPLPGTGPATVDSEDDTRSISSYGAGPSDRAHCDPELAHLLEAGMRQWRASMHSGRSAALRTLLAARAWPPRATYAPCPLAEGLHEHLQDAGPECVASCVGVRQCLLNWFHDAFEAAWRRSITSQRMSDVPAALVNAILACATDVAELVRIGAAPSVGTRSAARAAAGGGGACS